MNDELEQFLEEYERQESDKNMHFSTYYIPSYYQTEDENAV